MSIIPVVVQMINIQRPIIKRDGNALTVTDVYSIGSINITDDHDDQL